MPFFSRLGLPELVIILVIVLLLFGATRLPQVASALGKSVRAFRKGAGVEEGTPVKRRATRPRKDGVGTPRA